MNAGQVIEEIQRLPDKQVQRVYQYLFSMERELDRVLAAFDRLPRKKTSDRTGRSRPAPRARGSAAVSD
jgi:hypothetical protein